MFIVSPNYKSVIKKNEFKKRPCYYYFENFKIYEKYNKNQTSRNELCAPGFLYSETSNM